MAGKKMKNSDRVFVILEVGAIVGTADQLVKQLEETTLLTDEEKAPYTTTLAGLATLLANHTRPTYKALTKKGP